MQIFGEKKFKNPLEVITAFDNFQFKEAFEKIEKFRTQNHYILGYITYEARKIFLGKSVKSNVPLLYFEVFDKFDNFISEKTNDDILLEIKPKISKDEYKNAISKIKSEIKQGNTYEVNYTYDWEVKTNIEGFLLYQKLLQQQKTPYNFYSKNDCTEILSFSPELFFELRGSHIETKPMKGTIGRGKNQSEDLKNIEFLKNDVKNCAENVMIVDLLRNDLGKIAKTGSVNVDKLFEVETHKTIHQMTSSISAELERDIKLYDIFNAIFPCGSITGAPKISTMKIIESLESGKREVYCGAIGLIEPEKTTFSVPIRILERKLQEKSFTCRVGGAIVWDSDANEEWKETLTKIKFLENKSHDNFKIVETIKVENGKLLYRKSHFERMRKTASHFGFKFNYDILRYVPKKDGIMRILLDKTGKFEVQIVELKPSKTNIVKISKEKIYSKEPFLKVKTTYRPWYEDSFEKIRVGEIYDELFFNEKDELCEGARSNVIVEKDVNSFTPESSCGLLRGVLRENLLKKGKLTAKKIFLDDLKNADRVFCINSVRGIVEVKVDFNR